jgi:hypothetical protein
MAIKKTAKPVTKTQSRPKRPSDPSQFAHFMVKATTERDIETPEPPAVTKSEISRVMAELGRRGGEIGGKRRMETLTQERRSQIAYKAAQARWAKKTKKA